MTSNIAANEMDVNQVRHFFDMLSVGELVRINDRELLYYTGVFASTDESGKRRPHWRDWQHGVRMEVGVCALMYRPQASGVPGFVWRQFSDMFNVARGFSETMELKMDADIIKVGSDAFVSSELKALELEQFSTDVETLNRLANEYAENKDLCGEYERCLSAINCSVNSFQLTGRTRNYLVEGTVQVTLSIPFEASVRATSEDDAREEVEGWSAYDVKQRVSGDNQLWALDAADEIDISIDDIDVDE